MVDPSGQMHPSQDLQTDVSIGPRTNNWQACTARHGIDADRCIARTAQAAT